MTQVAMSSLNMNGIESYDGYLKMPLVQLRTHITDSFTEWQKHIAIPHPSLTAEEFTRMGDVSDIVAPNLFHHLGIKKQSRHCQKPNFGASMGLNKNAKICLGKVL
ncbi:MAG: hypothetical protein IPN04_06210 [Rhodoferax sp.]|nr:hypothetical protein [Rhodoferax sp.]